MSASSPPRQYSLQHAKQWSAGASVTTLCCKRAVECRGQRRCYLWCSPLGGGGGLALMEALPSDLPLSGDPHSMPHSRLVSGSLDCTLCTRGGPAVSACSGMQALTAGPLTCRQPSPTGAQGWGGGGRGHVYAVSSHLAGSLRVERSGSLLRGERGGGEGTEHECSSRDTTRHGTS